MKKITTLLFVIISAAILGSCLQEITDNDIVPQNMITMTVNAGVCDDDAEDELAVGTKTVVSGSSIKWSTTQEKIKVYQKATTGGTPAITSVNSNVGTSSDSYVTMSFNVTLPSMTADNLTYYGSYPSSSCVSNSSSETTANLSTPSAQSPTTNSFDRDCDLLIAKSIDNGTTQPTSLSMQFARVISIGKMTISNLPVDEYVNKVTFAANNGSAVVLAGRTTFDLETATPSTSYGDQLAKTSLEINTSSLLQKATSSMDIWFTCYPFELSTGDTFTVEVETETYVMSRTITIPSARELNFVEGKVSRFSVNMSSATVTKMQAWVLYDGDFSAGDYLIVSNSQAMTAGISSDKFTYAGVTANGDNEIFSNRADMVWRAAASSTYWTLYNPDADKYAASTGVANKAQLLGSGSDDKKLWVVTGDGSYEFVNKQNTTNGVNANLRYNPSNGFACYGTGTGSALLLYKKDTRPYLSTPATVTAALNGSDDSVIDVTFSAVANAGTYVIVAKPAAGETITKEGVTSSPATISVADGLAYETEYEISVYAVPSDASSYRSSMMKTAASTVTTGERPTPSLGTMIWSEDFTGWTAWTSSASGISHVYGGGTVSYSRDDSGTDYKNESTAGGTKPEVMVKASGHFTVSNIPVTSATSATLFYTTNNEKITVSTSPASTVTVKNYGVCAPRVRAIEITSIPAATDLMNIVLTGGDSNSRIDNLVLKAGTKSFQTLSFTNSEINWFIGKDCTIDVEKSAPQTVTGANTAVTYSSSDETVAIVNASTGAITVKKAGTVSITATAIETASYWSSQKSYTLNVSETLIAVSWSRPSSSDVYTTGFTFSQVSGTTTGGRQDGGGSADVGTQRYISVYHETNKLFATTPASVTFKAVIGGGSVKNPLGSNVFACFIDKDGNEIAGSSVTVTNKVEVTTGKEYSVSMSTSKATDAYGVKIYHAKESGYNVRYYSFALEYE